eukprot:4646182-Pyramimonas_sp.AAC.1
MSRLVQRFGGLRHPSREGLVCNLSQIAHHQSLGQAQERASGKMEGGRSQTTVPGVMVGWLDVLGEMQLPESPHDTPSPANEGQGGRGNKRLHWGSSKIPKCRRGPLKHLGRKNL